MYIHTYIVAVCLRSSPSLRMPLFGFPAGALSWPPGLQPANPCEPVFVRSHVLVGGTGMDCPSNRWISLYYLLVLRTCIHPVTAPTRTYVSTCAHCLLANPAAATGNPVRPRRLYGKVHMWTGHRQDEKPSMCGIYYSSPEGKDEVFNDEKGHETQRPLQSRVPCGDEREEERGKGKKKGLGARGSACTSTFSRRSSFAVVRLDSTWANGMLSAPSPKSLGTAYARIPS